MSKPHDDGEIQEFFSFTNPKRKIFRMICYHYSPPGQGHGERYFLYSCKESSHPWHLDARKAWAELDTLEDRQ